MVDIIFKARHTDVRERFRKHATAKLAKIEKLDSKAMRVDVEITTERNPRLADRREKIELTVSSRGPTIRAEAAAEDRFAALDMALAKLESRLRRACDRRKARHGAGVRLIDLPETAAGIETETPGPGDVTGSAGNGAVDAAAAEQAVSGVVPIDMQGEGPLVVREKFHAASPMTIDQALLEMELVGHDFYLFTDAGSGMPSVVYRRRGYRYGVIRLLEEEPAMPAGPARADWPAQRQEGNGQFGQESPASPSQADASRRTGGL